VTGEQGIERPSIVALEEDRRAIKHLLLFQSGNHAPDLFAVVLAA
jgi:hypothetical protein